MSAPALPGWAPPLLVLPAEPRPGPDGDLVERVEALLTGSGRYLLQEWVPSLGLQPSGDTLRLPAGRLQDVTLVRGGGMAALTHAVGAAGGYVPAGIDVAAATAQGRHLVEALVAAHRSVAGPPGWGGTWQSSLWASQVGLAAWLLGDVFEAGVVDGLGLMVADEANVLQSKQVEVMRDPSGRLVRPGDSASEEVSWEARLLSLAVLVVPSPRRDLWRQAQVARQVAAFAVPEDVHSQERLHGWPLCAWLPGSNVEPDGSVINHQRVHPGYMRSPNAGASVLHAALAGADWSPSATRGLDRTYACLVDRVWPSPPYEPPGGTSYVRGSADVYFPSGNDWGTAQPVQFLLNDVQAAVLGLDGLASVPALEWLELRLAAVEAQAARHSDGRIYASFEEMRSELREPNAAAKLAEAWLTLRLGSGLGGGTGRGGRERRPLARRPADPLLDPPDDPRPPCRGRPLSTFPDVAGDVGTAAGWLASRGVLHGRGDGRFDPEAPLPVAELLLALFRRSGRPDAVDAYTDLDPASEMGRAARWAVTRGLVGADADLGAPVTREALAEAVWREAAGPGPVAPGAGGGVLAWARAEGLLQGRVGASPEGDAPVTRGQVALVLWRQAGRPRA